MIKYYYKIINQKIKKCVKNVAEHTHLSSRFLGKLVSDRNWLGVLLQPAVHDCNENRIYLVVM